MPYIFLIIIIIIGSIAMVLFHKKNLVNKNDINEELSPDDIKIIE